MDQELTGLHMDAGSGVDTSFYLDQWKGVSPLCEIVCIDFDEARAAAGERAVAPATNDNEPQLSLFSEAA